MYHFPPYLNLMVASHKWQDLPRHTLAEVRLEHRLHFLSDQFGSPLPPAYGVFCNGGGSSGIVDVPEVGAAVDESDAESVSAEGEAKSPLFPVLKQFSSGCPCSRLELENEVGFWLESHQCGTS